MRWMLFSSCALSFLFAGALRAEDRAATSELPSALQSIGLTSQDVSSVDQAHRVRGQGGYAPGIVIHYGNPHHQTRSCLPPPPPPPSNCHPPRTCPPPHCPPPTHCQPCRPGVGQGMTFTVSGGTSHGQVVLTEGVVGQFLYSRQGANNNLVVQGSFGGLSGNLGTDSSGNLSFVMAGKALQETVAFTAGQFNQVFTQSYRR